MGQVVSHLLIKCETPSSISNSTHTKKIQKEKKKVEHGKRVGQRGKT
jgi:hypothetical protein